MNNIQEAVVFFFIHALAHKKAVPSINTIAYAILLLSSGNLVSPEVVKNMSNFSIHTLDVEDMEPLKDDGDAVGVIVEAKRVAILFVLSSILAK